MEQIMILKIPYQLNEKEDYIYPVVLRDDREMVMIDCGYSDFLPQIEKALREQGFEPGCITKIIATHHDHDHMGSLAAFKKNTLLCKSLQVKLRLLS